MQKDTRSSIHLDRDPNIYSDIPSNRSKGQMDRHSTLFIALLIALASSVICGRTLSRRREKIK